MDNTLRNAIENNDIKHVKELIDEGANVNQADTRGVTPLWVAAQEGQLDVAQLLLDRGAEVNRPNIYGVTPLHIAVHNGHREIVDLLREAQDRTEKTEPETDKINIIAKKMDNTLRNAIYENDVKLVKELIDEGADVNKALTTDGDTPLCIAARYGQLDVAQLLLDRGAEVNKADRYGSTPLYIAARYGQLAVAELLLDKGAEVNLANTYGATPLWIAVQEGKLDVAKLLIDKGADVNKAETTYGRAPLWVAEKYGHTEIVNLLREAQDRAKKTKPETDKINPEHYKTGGIETFDYLKAKLTAEQLKGFCKGNIIKYITRADQKNKKEDLEKAKWYLEKLIKEY